MRFPSDDFRDPETYYPMQDGIIFNGKNIYIHKSNEGNIDMKVDTIWICRVTNWTNCHTKEIPALFDQY